MSGSHDAQSDAASTSKVSAGNGRPRKLDDSMRREICALVAGGCGLREAARYVRCSVKTIRREADRNPQFQDQLRRSEMYAQLSPLRAMQSACSTHWRAAAWFLERAFPDRFARPDPGAFGPRQARHLLNEVLHIVSSEVSNRIHYERIEKRIRGTFEYSIRAACDRRRSARDLRQAMSFFNDKDAADPLAQLGFPIPDFESLFKPLSSASSSRPPASQQPTVGGDSVADNASRPNKLRRTKSHAEPPVQPPDRQSGTLSNGAAMPFNPHSATVKPAAGTTATHPPAQPSRQPPDPSPKPPSAGHQSHASAKDKTS